MLSPQPHPRARWAGPLLLGAAALYLLALRALRERLPDVPNLLWAAVLVALFAAGGAATARGLAWDAPPARRRRLARLVVLAGAAGLGLGSVGASDSAAGWTEGVRAAAALTALIAFGLIAGGAVLARRSGGDATPASRE